MKCLLCDELHLHEILNLGSQPLANKYPTREQFQTEDFFPLSILFCERCKNVQLGTIVSRERMFEEYYYLSSVNLALVRHFQQLARKLAGANFVVDVGSNDGILLKPLKELGIRSLGIEPSINVSKIANDLGLPTMCAFFTEKVAREVAETHGKPDVIVASSVFTHLENPHEFIEAVKVLLSDTGRFIIEVEYIGNFLKNVQFERFYLDRVFYYSLTSLKHLFEMHGMSIVDVEQIEPHGGSLQVSVQRTGAAASPSLRVADQIAIEHKQLTLPELDKFKVEVDRQVKALRDLLDDFKSKGIRVGGYGAPARVSTICNYGGIGPELIEFTVDDSPLKQNKFSPGTHIPIVPRSYLEAHPPEVLIVFAYEYLEDIRKKTHGSFRYFVPIPPREVP
jgi:SAM-dependent methyltransferase